LPRNLSRIDSHISNESSVSSREEIIPWTELETIRNRFKGPIFYENKFENLNHRDCLQILFEWPFRNECYRKIVENKALQHNIDLITKSLKKRKDTKTLIKKFIYKCCYDDENKEADEIILAREHQNRIKK
jgi:hypothetical protein